MTANVVMISNGAIAKIVLRDRYQLFEGQQFYYFYISDRVLASAKMCGSHL